MRVATIGLIAAVPITTTHAAVLAPRKANPTSCAARPPVASGGACGRPWVVVRPTAHEDNPR